MIKIISFTLCPFVQRVTAALESRSIPYEIEYISLDNPPAWFAEVSPNQQVPLLITESGMVLFESDAIVEYLDEAYTPLEPQLSPEQRAIDRAWSYQASQHYLTQCSAMSSADEATLAERAEKLNRAFAKAEKALGEGPFFKGESISNVDIAWLVLLHRAAIIEQRTGYDFLAGLPKVQAWQSALMATGLAEQSVSSEFDDVFAGYYLSERTSLGRGGNGETGASGLQPAASCCG